MLKNPTSLLSALALCAGVSGASAQNFSGGVDLNYLGLAHSEGQAVGFGFTPAPRIWGEFETSGGLLIGFDWFQLKASSPDLTSRYDEILMRSANLTVGTAFGSGGTEIKVTGGLAFNSYREDDTVGPNFLEVPNAIGLSAGIEANQDFGNGFSAYGGATGTILYAPEYTDAGITYTAPITYNTIDLELGLQYSGSTGGGNSWFAKAGLGTRMWNGVSDGDSENTSAYGLRLSVGMTF